MALARIVAVSALIVSALSPVFGGLIHFLSICFPSELAPLVLSNTK